MNAAAAVLPLQLAQQSLRVSQCLWEFCTREELPDVKAVLVYMYTKKLPETADMALICQVRVAHNHAICEGVKGLGADSTLADHACPTHEC